MRRIRILLILALAPIYAIHGAAKSPAAQRGTSDPSALEKTELPIAAGGPSRGKHDAGLKPIALFWGAMPAGVAVSRSGRIFVTFPRWSDRVEFSVGEIGADGTLRPYPNAQMHQIDAKPRLISVQGIDIDDRNHLWLLDTANATLSAFDLENDTLIKQIRITNDVLKPGYLNDVRIDTRRGKGGFAFISDSAAGGIIVVDLALGECWRRLQNHPSSKSTPDFVGNVEGEELKHRSADGKESPMRGNTDGIALSPDGQTLYYTPFSQRSLFSISTEALADRAMSDAQVEAKIQKLCDKPSANDGLTCDAKGRAYSTDYEDGAIRRIAGDKIEILVRDERLLWPDALFVHGGDLYITTNQLNRLPGLHGGKDLREEPFALFRLPL